METITIPKKMSQKGDLVVISQKEYQELLRVRGVEGELKPAVKKRLDRLQKEAMAGKNLSPAFSTPEEMDAYLNAL